MYDATLIMMTLNELPGVRAVLPRVPRHLVRECFVVDGGSTDGTREYLQSQGIRVIEQSSPGWGEAALTGAELATTAAAVFFSPDGNQDPADIPILLNELEQGHDLVIASRFLMGGVHEQDGQFLRSRARGGRAFTELANRQFGHGQSVTDATHGYRAFRREAVLALELNAPGFELSYQMTIRALKAGLRIAETPTFEAPRITGTSRAHPLTASLGHLRILLHEKWRKGP